MKIETYKNGRWIWTIVENGDKEEPCIFFDWIPKISHKKNKK